jgi:hypothetical protein
MKKELVLAVALALGSTVALAAGEASPCKGPDGKPVDVSKFDTDKDGTLSAAECAKATEGPGAAGRTGESGAPAGAQPEKPAPGGDKKY